MAKRITAKRTAKKIDRALEAYLDTLIPLKRRQAEENVLTLVAALRRIRL